MIRALSLLALLSIVAASWTPARAGTLEIHAFVDGAWRRGPVDLRVDTPVRLRVMRNGRELPPQTQTEWIRVMPHLQHVEGHAEGAASTDPTYSNAVLGGPRHGAWMGMDTIEYTTGHFEHAQTVDGELHLSRAPGAGERAPSNLAPGAGTLFISARVSNGESTTETAGVNDQDHLGLSAQVMRVSFRQSDDFLGWMSVYFGVPYVFGSTPRQSERRVGIDCADVLVAARRLQTGRRLDYTSVRGIGRLATAQSEPFSIDSEGIVRDEEDEPLELRWGRDLAPGDMLAIDYQGADSELPRAWDHIGALLEDARDSGIRGRLDGADLIRHMGRRGLTDGPLAQHGPIRARVWRWSTRRRRR